MAAVVHIQAMELRLINLQHRKAVGVPETRCLSRGATVVDM